MRLQVINWRRCCPSSCSRSAPWRCLMLGAYRGQETTRTVTALAVLLLVVVGVLDYCAAGGQARDLRRQLHRRRFRPLHEDPGADRLGGDAGPVDRVPVRPVAPHLRIRDPGAALDARHDGADLGRRPDLALSRPRADVARALCRGGLEPRQRQVDRSRPEVLRARRAVLGHAALRLLAGLRLHRHGQLHRHRGGRDGLEYRPGVRPGLPARRPLLQGLGGAVPHVDARRLRGRADAGHRLLRLGAEGGRARRVHRASR